MKKFLFFDYWVYEYVENFKRRLFQPEKSQTNPVFVSGEREYEYNSCGYVTVMHDRDEDIFKMWYETSNMYDANTKAIKYLCYATSRDGILWKRPDLDVVPGTNIVMTPADNPMGSSIIRDAFDHEFPYKLIMRPKYTPAIVGYQSNDGIHWTRVSSEPIIDANSDCKVSLYQDRTTRTYHAYFRLKKGQRVTYASTSKDFLHWSPPVLVLEPHIDDGTQVQIYGLQAAAYGNYAIGLTPMYNTEKYDLLWAKMKGTMDISLTFGKSPYYWQWAQPGSRFIPLGNDNSWDCGMIHPGTAPIYLPDEIRFYYSGSSYNHGDSLSRNDHPQGIGYASMRPDGFVGLESRGDAGRILTRPFAVIHPDIYVNADCTNGSLRIEVQDDTTGRPIQGYELENCIPMKSDETAWRMCWKSQIREDITNRGIRILVEAENCTLYSLACPNGNNVMEYDDFDEILCVDPMRDISARDYHMQI